MSEGEESDYDVPDLPPMLPELEELPPITPSSFTNLGGGGSQAANASGAFDAGAGGDGSAPGDGTAAAAAAKPKKIRKPMPKLDAIRLIDSEKGLPHLVQDFKSIRFKGKGHEASDIRMLMRRYEHWSHRLFPKYPLRNTTEIIELSLAAKKEVKVCMAQLRRGGDGEPDVDDILEPEPVMAPLPAL